MTAELILVHCILTAWCVGYAAVLDRIHDLYSPRYIWATVVAGDVWIGLAFGACLLIGTPPTLVPWLYISLHVAAGVPIVLWQLYQNYKRDTERGNPHAAVDEKRPSGA